MNLNVLTYLLYLALALPLTLWVGRALHRYGQVFLIEVFSGDEALAHAVNQLLVVGFYLVNLGYVALFMKSTADVDTARRLFEVLSTKFGGVALFVGVVHFGNIWAFNAFRRRAVERARPAPEPSFSARPAPEPSFRARPAPPLPHTADMAPAPAAYPPPAPVAYPPPALPHTANRVPAPPAYPPSAQAGYPPPVWTGWTSPGAGPQPQG